MADLVRCRVTGPRAVSGVSAPGAVELDPDAINVDALVQAGHVKVLPVSAPKSRKAEKAES